MNLSNTATDCSLLCYKQYIHTKIVVCIKSPRFIFYRVQPQVFIYPGGTSGQPFLLQPGAPPGNFLIPQPQPGFVLRDVPATRPDVFVSGYPKPAYVPPINKDAEEIPTSPGMVNPTTSLGKLSKSSNMLELILSMYTIDTEIALFF